MRRPLTPNAIARVARALTTAALALSLCACAWPPQQVDNWHPPPPAAPAGRAAQPAEQPPLGRLPADVRPTRYKLALEVAPDRDRFSGTVEMAIELGRARDTIWMHAKDVAARKVTVQLEGQELVSGSLQQVTDGGVAAVRLPRAVGPGKATLVIEYEAPFGRLEGLYKVQSGGKPYLFTQLESVFARRMFPGFDEPAFKTPYDVTLVVPKGMPAIANTTQTARAPGPNGMDRVTFATTEPLPTYLLAIAVGDLDIVEAPPIAPNEARKRPLPFRGVAVKGRGKELAYALQHTPAILATLERYFGIEYPYDKLDIIAVPDKGGAMENAGAVTFGELLLLLDEKTAPVAQQRAYAYVMAHELAHQWFGDLVTMPWWDDIWLNEAFATWMGYKATAAWRPDLQADIRALEGVHEAMVTDSLLSARQIRQEVRDNGDILNAFDSITYKKGGGVLSMFERWVGAEAFRRGVQQYLAAHRHGSATADDFLGAVSKAAGKDVTTPFKSFLFQAGLPLVEARISCGAGKPRLELAQSRFLPLGSTGDPKRTWQIPVCARYPVGAEVKETCTLLAEEKAGVDLEGTACPGWVLPNADASGYYRWMLSVADTRKLAAAGWAKLGPRERTSFAESLRTGWSRGTLPAAELMPMLAPLADDPQPAVVAAAASVLDGVHDWLALEPAGAEVEAYGRKIFAKKYREVGWAAPQGKAEPPERRMLRKEVVSFMVTGARDAGARREAAARGKAYLGIGKDDAFHPEAVDPNLAEAALAALGETESATAFDALSARLDRTTDEVVRRRLLAGLGAPRDAATAARARTLTLDPRLRVIEALLPLGAQLAEPTTREAAWKYFVENVDAILARLSPARAAGVISVAAVFCDRARADEVERVLGPRWTQLEGGARNLAATLETIRICAARRDKQLAETRAWFTAGKPAGGAAPAPPGTKPATAKP
ncbi:MAG: M1 family metallopeptidase [Polyangiaceae bacterium]